MKRRLLVQILVAGALALGAVAACTPHITSNGHGRLAIAGHEVRITVPGAPEAYVQSGGGLVIGERTLPLTPAEQTRARLYYQYARGIVAAGEATGEAGSKLGVAVVGSLFSALWHDNSAIVNRTAHAGAAKVQEHVQALCTQLAGLESEQNALAAALPAFARYRVIRQSDVAQCIKGAERHAARKS